MRAGPRALFGSDQRSCPTFSASSFVAGRRGEEERRDVETNEYVGAKRRGTRWPFSRHPVSVNYQAALPSVAWRFN